MSLGPRLERPSPESLRLEAARKAHERDVLMRRFAIGVCIVSMVGLALLLGGIWLGVLRQSITRNCFDVSRMLLGVFVALYAIYCGWRLITKWVAIPRELNQDFVPELIALSIFWVLAPPIWFFVEYLAVANDCIINFPGKPENLGVIKDYADYASKIWAGVLALFLALIALKK